MSKTSVILITALFLSPLLVYFLWPSDENRIRKLFREGAGAIETEKIDEVMKRVSFSYRDDYGMSYLTMKKVLEDVFMRWSDISISHRVKSIEIRDKKATVELDVRATAAYGQDKGYVLGDAASPVAMKFDLEKEHLQWVIVRTEGLPRRY